MAKQTLTAKECASLIASAARVSCLTGAGISTAAGIPDFRGPKGLYVTRQYDPETVFEIGCFRHDPKPFYGFTRDFLGLVDTLKPTFAHKFLAKLEQAGKLTSVITQNIDPLHEIAGSKRVIAVHGGYSSSHCLDCGQACSFSGLREKMDEAEIPRCGCGGVIKPDVVFFGENVRDMEAAQREAERSDLFFVLGSSLAVFPAAMLPQYAGGKVVVVNQGEVALDPGAGRYFVGEKLDDFFRAVALEMGLAVE